MNYKYATWVLAVVVVILGFLLWQENNKSVISTVDAVSERVADCRAKLAAWNEKNPSGTATVQTKAELDLIMSNCLRDVEASQNDIKGSQQDVGGQ